MRSCWHDWEPLNKDWTESTWKLVQVSDDAIVAEWEVLEIWDEFYPWLSWCLRGAPQAQDACLWLILWFRLLGCCCRFWGVENYEDVEIFLLLCFLHIFSHVVFVESAIRQNYDKRTADAAANLRLGVLKIEQLVCILHKVSHREVMAILARVLEFVLAHDEGRPLIWIGILKGLEYLHSIPNSRNRNFSDLKSIQRFHEGDHSLKREEAKVLLIHRQRIIDCNQNLVIPFRW